MRPRNVGAPEVVPSDIEGGGGSFSKTVSMAGSGGRPIIQPFEGMSADGKTGKPRRGSTPDKEFLQKVAMGAAGVWLVTYFLLGWDMLWPVYLVFDFLGYFLSFPPFSWFSGWFNQGAPGLLNQGQLVEEAMLPQGQVAQYVDSYVQQYGDAALIFAVHDGYPQIVKEILFNEDLGYRDLIDARDDSGNTALIYAASKGFRQCVAALLRAGADPELPNQGSGGRTPLMEAAGGGFKDIVQALRMMPNVSVDLQDEHGNTALHYAAYHGHLQVVMELLKSSPNKEIKNIYGHTAASYAASNKFKGVADVLNRPETRAQRKAKEAANAAADPAEADPDPDQVKAFEEQIKEQLKKYQEKKEKESKHVKGKAENLHEKDSEDFEPKFEKAKDSISQAETKALEDQLAKLRRQHEEAELKSQKKIVELLEKSSEQQRALDEAREKHREYQLNHTELSLKVGELESKHRSSLLKAEEEADRAREAESKHREIQLELERHKNRADAMEKERDQHAELAKRHQESAERSHSEVNDHLTKMETHMKELSELRDKLRKADDEKQKEEDRVRQLQEELKRLKGDAPSAGSKPAESGATRSEADLADKETVKQQEEPKPEGQATPEAAPEATPEAKPEAAEAKLEDKQG
eukprot:gb/GFBE01000832.1/.p1 GENE.gb/GFBE01000832.1/~~gb/GFBE01000832.1/.p1  ORF type:complete len:638 (+),score=180.11 gb/GFBE01000832.1/:1-1914(+)